MVNPKPCLDHLLGRMNGHKMLYQVFLSGILSASRAQVARELPVLFVKLSFQMTKAFRLLLVLLAQKDVLKLEAAEFAAVGFLIKFLLNSLDSWICDRLVLMEFRLNIRRLRDVQVQGLLSLLLS